jgi:hypothetical protein
MPSVELPDLNRLTVEEVAALRRACERHLETWFAFSPQGRAGRTPAFEAATRWRLDGKTEPCCNCGEPYPAADLHFGDEIYCPGCRGNV